MNGVGTWLAAMMAPLAGRVLAALGFSVVSIAGVSASIEGIKAILVARMALVPAGILDMMALCGAGEAIGLILGALMFRLALWQVSNVRRVLGVAS